MANYRLLVCLLGSLWLAEAAHAWTNHAPGSVLALSALPGVAGRTVEVEALEDFLSAESAGLVEFLAQQETFSRKHFPQVPVAPAALRWTGEAANKRQGFLHALRLNPDIKLAYFIQDLPGSTEHEGLTPVADSDVLIFSELDNWQAWHFYGLVPGQEISALAVLASAADEPDYGHDINLFEDNASAVAALYQFGVQPFGDSRFQNSSQAPFHMGYFHESAIVFTLGGFLKNTFADWRAYQYFALAKYAFSTGHDYWGYRFMGWGLHYVQDLTQPFHATVLPGASTGGMLWIYTQDTLGFSQAKQAAIARNADYHMYIETLQFSRLKALLTATQVGHPLVMAYSDDSSDGNYPVFTESYLRLVIAAQARASADQLDAHIEQNIASYPEADQLITGSALEAQLVELTQRFGAHSRAAVKAVVGK